MLTPDVALERVLERIRAPRGEESVPLAEAAGRSLAREVLSDVDLPPFEKSMMDGYAARSADLEAPGALTCVGESRAGAPFQGSVPAGSCIEIYTGAELPAELDAVCMVEKTRREGDQVHFESALRPAENVSHTGEILAAGKAVYGARRRLSPADLSVLASVGCDPVPVFPRPVVSVLTTGDELVPAREKPGEGQIREGNTLYLKGACEALGCRVRQAGIVPDEEAALEAAFRGALEEGDALITTGGVSVGKYDLVGATFEKIGVEPVLHKVAIKPGKPIWFGLAGETPVFGLPGNPVSSLLGFEVFVRPALARIAGHALEEERERILFGRWSGPERRGSDRQHNLPARVVPGEDGVEVIEPLAFRGSADIVTAARADALVVVPAEGSIRTGEIVRYRPLSR